MARATKTADVQGDREWLGLRELTAYASVSQRTLRTWIHRAVNPLPAIQVAGKILVRRSQFDAWLEQHRIQAMASLNVDGIVGELMGTAR